MNKKKKDKELKIKKNKKINNKKLRIYSIFLFFFRNKTFMQFATMKN